MAFLTDDLTIRAFDNRIPYSVTFELTHRCNLRCSHCYIAQPSASELSTGEVKTVLDMLARKQCLFCTFTGGELFTRPDAIALIDYATNRGFALTIKSNGTLLTPAIIGALKSLCVMEVHVSVLGGTADVHDGITGVPGSFDAVWKAVDRMSTMGINVVIMSVITRGAVAAMEEIHHRANNAGIDHVNFSAILFPGYAGDPAPEKLRCTDQELELFYSTTRRLYGSETPERQEPYPSADERFLSCTALQNGFTLQPDGTVIACQSIPASLGNITTEPLEKILFSRQADSIIRQLQLSSNTTCSSCGDHIGCLRCPGLAYLEDGALDAVPREACRHDRVFRALLQKKPAGEEITV
jgi:AdoMet-dependent heme synthase